MLSILLSFLSLLLTTLGSSSSSIDNVYNETVTLSSYQGKLVLTKQDFAQAIDRELNEKRWAA